MKITLKMEEAAMVALAVYLNTFLPFAWSWYWVLFLAPDLSMLGYLVNPRIGAWSYNLLHHKGLAIVVYIAGLSLANNELQFAGLLLFGHSSFDRLLGYGLKYQDSFKNTHLGVIGREQYGK